MNLNDLLVYPVPEVRNLANEALELRKRQLAGELTTLEFNELLGDLKLLRNINQEMVDVEVMRELVEAANLIDMVRHWLP